MDAYGDLGTFGLGDMVRLAGSLRALGEDVASVEDFAEQVCRHLHEHLVDENGQPQTVLVRFYGTVTFGALPAAEQAFVQNLSNVPAPDGLTCLTLLGTVGTQPEWNDRRKSVGHRAIPLTDEKHVASLPMVAALLEQLGINVHALLTAQAHLLAPADDHRHGVFHVPRAQFSPAIPAQDFVAEYGVESVLGFGGALPTGEVYAVVLFASVPVPRESARMFETVALSMTLAALEMLDLPIFRSSLPADGRPLPARVPELARGAARESALRALLAVHERIAVTESDAAARALDRATHEAQRYGGLARTLQASLIPPSLPDITGVETGAVFRPAGDGSEVGGDFYDLFPVREGLWGLVLGDVSGKGAGAAALTALARYTVRAAAFHAGSGIEVLERLDEALRRQETDERYLTALFAFLRPSDGMLTVDLTLGGHPQPLVVRAGGLVEPIGSPGSVLGLLANPFLVESRHQLHAGDCLVSFTDGVTEARRGREQYGEARLLGLLQTLLDATASEVAQRVGQDVLHFQEGVAHDDTALVVLRCR